MISPASHQLGLLKTVINTKQTKTENKRWKKREFSTNTTAAPANKVPKNDYSIVLLCGLGVHNCCPSDLAFQRCCFLVPPNYGQNFGSIRHRVLDLTDTLWSCISDQPVSVCFQQFVRQKEGTESDETIKWMGLLLLQVPQIKPARSRYQFGYKRN